MATVIAAAGLLVAGLLVAGCGSATTSTVDQPFSHSLFGPFAGYVWTGEVHRLSAVVKTPRISRSSPPGVGATWIGATGVQRTKILATSFFQIGINEIRNHNPLVGKVGDSYYVFWSSTAKRFRPQFLYSVTPGDLVRLTMALDDGRWLMDATDESTGHSRRVSISAGRDASYEQASWLEEDVATDEAGDQAPYPDLAGLRVSQLKVNSTAPSSPTLVRSWMSTARGTFGPTPIRAGGFSVTRVHLSAADLRYENIAYAVNYPADAFARDLESWNSHTGRAAISRACRSFALALQRNIASFQAYEWPADVRPLIRRLVAAAQRSRTVVLALARLSPSKIKHGTAAYEAATARVGDVALEVKARLHIPPDNYSGGAVVAYAHAHAH